MDKEQEDQKDAITRLLEAVEDYQQFVKTTRSLQLAKEGLRK